MSPHILRCNFFFWCKVHTCAACLTHPCFPRTQIYTLHPSPHSRGHADQRPPPLLRERLQRTLLEPPTQSPAPECHIVGTDGGLWGLVLMALHVSGHSQGRHLIETYHPHNPLHCAMYASMSCWLHCVQIIFILSYDTALICSLTNLVFPPLPSYTLTHPILPPRFLEPSRHIPPQSLRRLMAARLAAFRVAPSPLPSKTALHFPLPCGVQPPPNLSFDKTLAQISLK